MNSGSVKIDNSKWSKILIKAQLMIAGFVFLTEIVDNCILYLTRSQGYGPDTIVEKLIRYLVITSATNFAIVIVSAITERKCKNEELQKYLLMFFTVLICTNVAYSHYQLVTSFIAFGLPVIISILYEDRSLTRFSMVTSFGGLTVAALAKGLDPEYSEYTLPETAIVFCFLLGTYVLSGFINSTMENRRNDLESAVIETEEAKADAEKMTLSMKMLETLAGTIDAKDKYTNGHSIRVAKYSMLMAEEIGYDHENVARLKYEALLHDIGKIGIPDSILNKPTRLTETEFSLIKSHTLIGADILKNMIALPSAARVAKHHHERIDGKGYPSGLKDQEIPLNARIVCIADAYDAMSSDRVYRKALSQDVIKRELLKGRGTQFDPNLIDLLIRLMDEGRLELDEDDQFFDITESTQQLMVEDIDALMGKVAVMDDKYDSLRDFDRFYEYVKSIGARYGRSIEVISVDIRPEDPDVENTLEHEDAASDVLEVAIRKSIRAVDLYYRYSPRTHLIVLLDAGVSNLDIVRNRILSDYDKLKADDSYAVEFTLNESIENKK